MIPSISEARPSLYILFLFLICSEFPKSIETNDEWLLTS